MKPLSIVSTSLDYTWQITKGNASDPYETAARVDAHEDPRPRNIVLNWDQRHTVNLTVTLSKPQDFNVSGVCIDPPGRVAQAEREKRWKARVSNLFPKIVYEPTVADIAMRRAGET